MGKLTCLILLLSFFSSRTSAQQTDHLVQFSGVIMTSDSLRAIPFANIIIKNVGRGTISNYEGFFSFVAKKGDTIGFSAIGYKDKQYVIPPDLGVEKYSIIQLMTRDTVHLPETVIYPWPTPEQFREAFLSLNIPDDDLERAKKNLERERLKALGLAMKMDANENQDYYQRQQAAKFYYNGQYPPLNIFNPLAWAKFIEAWQNGDFKSE